MLLINIYVVFNRLYDVEIGIEYRQTVCAAIVAVDRRAGGATFSVVALGVGTKFLRAAQISADGGAGRVVRDCHAEVLAPPRPGRDFARRAAPLRRARRRRATAPPSDSAAASTWPTA